MILMIQEINNSFTQIPGILLTSTDWILSSSSLDSLLVKLMHIKTTHLVCGLIGLHLSS